MIGQWFGVMQKLNLVQNFWFGHQGYEYVDLGRFWQIFLLIGLFLWLALMVRPLLPVLKRNGHDIKKTQSQTAMKMGCRNFMLNFLYHGITNLIFSGC